MFCSNALKLWMQSKQWYHVGTLSATAALFFLSKADITVTHSTDQISHALCAVTNAKEGQLDWRFCYLCAYVCVRGFLRSNQQFLWKFLLCVVKHSLQPHSALSPLWNSVGLCPSGHTLPACVSAEWWEAGSHRPHQHCLLYVTVSLLHCQTRNNKEEPQVIRQHFVRGFTQSLFWKQKLPLFSPLFFFAWPLPR